MPLSELASSVQALVMVPTYNEKENLGPLIARILSQGDRFGVVVVDDASPDGTGELADGLAADHPGRIVVVHRVDERGRGTAGIAGFRRALDLGVPYILEMDADFSHDPDDLPRLLDCCQQGADVAVGSRYILGGRQLDRSFARQFISTSASLLYRLILGSSVRDLSGGFKCYRREAMAGLDWGRFHSTGYAIGMETVFRLQKMGCRVREIPIVFADRRYGSSKFRLKEALDCVRVALKLVAELGRGVPA